MSDPIGSVDFRPIQFPEGGPSNGNGGHSNHKAASRDNFVDAHTAKEVRLESFSNHAVTVQARMQEAGSNVRVGIESVNGSTVFTVRDAETGQVIRKIPSDEALRISQNLDRLSGLYLDRLE